MKRFTTASAELNEVKHFDYVVFNEAGKLDDARAKLVARLAEEEKEKNGSKGS